jgi:exonuclease SbcC
MIPIRMRIAGFLSYQDPAELDFTGFDLACISGPNGAGKSTLLDAITWVLFGQARKRDDSLINLQCNAADVTLVFEYEDNEYRVQRSLTRGKTSVLEFQVRPPASAKSQGASDEWRPLTERTLRETQARIEQVLRLDYDTFVNASFFLQGKADQFAQQTAAKRKEVLGNILGMELWEQYKVRAADRRRALEAELASVDGRLAEIASEFAEEAPRRQRLAGLEADLTRLSAARKSQASSLEQLRKTRASLDKQRALMDQMHSALAQSRLQLSALQARLDDRQKVHAASFDVTRRAGEIEASFAAWKNSVQDLERWDRIATTFRDKEKHRLPLVAAIASEKARLEEERRQLLSQQQTVAERVASTQELEGGIQEARELLAAADERLAERARLESDQAAARESIATLKAENEVLKVEMDQLKTRIEALQAARGAVCPLCGQPLSEEHRASTLEAMQNEGKARGDRFRSNKIAAEERQAALLVLEARLGAFVSIETERLAHAGSLAQLTERYESLQTLARQWQAAGQARLSEVGRSLEGEQFAFEARARLAAVDTELAQLGYDAAGHDRARQIELKQRAADEAHRQLESARSALVPLENEIQNLQAEITRRTSEIAGREIEAESAQSALQLAQAELPDIGEAERLLFELQEQENLLNQQVGAARQKVQVLEDLRLRKAEAESARQSLALDIGRHKELERAFGKDGVPALLIEQALPEIETRANEILDRLSDGKMSVHFVTLADYKDRKREDRKETLDIRISDGAGARDYELYSGGEAFRVNFAIRLALSQVLAGRKGARLQTLVIDEGFASQDQEGRQRLIEAINLVKADFAKILLITHLEELKDAFPTRIEVEKTERGSHIHIA